MSGNSKLSFSAILHLLAVLLIFFAACASKKAAWGDPDKGLLISYRMPINQELKYNIKTDFAQHMEIMGEEVDVVSDSYIGFTMIPKKFDSDDYTIDVLVDTLNYTVTNPQGTNTADVSNVLGKGFSMHLTSHGKEHDMDDASELRFGEGTEFEGSVVTWFKSHFPDLPEGPVVLNDIWASADTISETTPRGNIELIFINQNQLSGFEKIKGHDCVRVTNNFTGTFSGNAKEQGMDLVFDGDIEGTEIYYFDYKRGQYLKGITEGTIDGVIEGSGQMELNIPMVRAFSVATELEE